MKVSLINSISKIANYTKDFITKLKNDIKFENNKNGVIKVMYASMLASKRKEKNMLVSELNNIKEETAKINKQIKDTKEENLTYNKKINALNSFQDFLLNNH